MLSLSGGGYKISLERGILQAMGFGTFSYTGKDWCGMIGENLALLCLLAACQDKIKL